VGYVGTGAMLSCHRAVIIVEYVLSFPDSRNFHAAVAKVKSGKGTSVFTERTDDSSAMQYFQVLNKVIISVCSFNFEYISTHFNTKY
jgi:hypothetical protein